jgi:hypothetical protein
MTRYNAYQIGISNGWLTTDEVRRMENLGPMPEREGPPQPDPQPAPQPPPDETEGETPDESDDDNG